MEYEARLREMDEKHQHELQELENAYQQKIMGEVERYQVIDASHDLGAHRTQPPPEERSSDCRPRSLPRVAHLAASPYRMHGCYGRRRLSRRETCSKTGGTNNSNSSSRHTKGDYDICVDYLEHAKTQFPSEGMPYS